MSKQNSTTHQQGNGARLKAYARRLATYRALSTLLAPRLDHEFRPKDGLWGGSCATPGCEETRYAHEGLAWRLLWHMGAVS
jgi:hypothetical protein